MLRNAVIVILCLALGTAAGWIAYPLVKSYIGAEDRQRWGQPISPAPGTTVAGGPFSSVVDAAFPTVVNISTVRVQQPDSAFGEDPFFDFFNDFLSPKNDFGPQKNWKEQNFGSGVIVSSDGYIITNNHVIESAERIRVTLYDGRVFKGQVIGSDPKTDIAVVKISANNLPALPWGDSDSLGVGQFVLAIGNPFGLSHTVTLGIVSAVGRANVGIADYEDFIQTDAAINPGNSGGPLVGADGTLVGINTAIFSRSGGYQGIGFAVPSNMVRLVMEQLVTEGRVIRGWLGVSIQKLTPELRRKFGFSSNTGALVAEAIIGSPAEDAGIRGGDIIIEYNGEAVTGPAELKNMVARSRPGTRAPVQIFRDGQVLRIVATVKELPGEAPTEARERRSPRPGHNGMYGLNIIALTEDIARQLGIQNRQVGVVVSSVREGSPADDAGLKRGDIIMEVEHRRIMGISEFKSMIAEQPETDTLLMLINRAGRKFFITMDITS